ncbi:MAG TPA: glycerate kinase [Microlunatus sp.]
MRVLICPDRMGALSSAEAGRALAAGWPGAEVRPIGAAGQGFVEATAAAWGCDLQTAVWNGSPAEWAVRGREAVLRVSGVSGAAVEGSPIPYASSSLVLGLAIAIVLTEHRPQQVLVDLAGIDVHDAGAGLLAGLGARGSGADLMSGVIGLTGLTAVDLDVVRERLADVELVGVVPAPEREAQLLGLRGITSRRGRAAGEDPAPLLAADSALQRLTELVAPGPATLPGAGACGGLGWVVLALGGRLVTGPELGLAGVTTEVDLLVSGCGVFDFATRGGGVVAAAADVAAALLAPCVIIAGEVLIGAREMRTMGIEAAYPIRVSSLDVPTGGDLTAEEVARVAVRVARSWHW